VTNHSRDGFDRDVESFSAMNGVSGEIMKCWKIRLKVSIAISILLPGKYDPSASLECRHVGTYSFNLSDGISHTPNRVIV
jgi:hypothetical protein